MGISRILRRRNLAALALLVLITGSVYGFAAANIVPESGAGDGDGDITGYSVTNITYDLDASDPTLLGSVSFDAAPSTGADDATEVTVRIDGAWFDCTGTAPSFTCDLTSGTVDVLSVTELRVVAVQ